MAAIREPWETRRSCMVNLPLRVLQMLRGSLRAKFIVVIVLLQVAVMGAVAVVMERHQQRAIIEQTRLRARSLAMSLAALSEGYLLNYNYIKLEQAT
jgi:cell division protein FtsL